MPWQWFKKVSQIAGMLYLQWNRVQGKAGVVKYGKAKEVRIYFFRYWHKCSGCLCSSNFT